ncbi:MAG: tRNA pseudouridine(55) synthase TruB [Patescibacteria group bacterium]|nr:tRNA pseudouridine(55) synthase TruB [Patescibacteria group bacterium]MCL5224338.1 tRNA pseudouridine(55) synthase TruB [Patescibacteria group bacterium]
MNHLAIDIDRLRAGGIFAFWKPKGPTSHIFLNQIRRLTGVSRVGHAGTLDPLASGILVVGIGSQSTKSLSKAVAEEKEYLAKVKLGYESTTDDEEGTKKAVGPDLRPSTDTVTKALSSFVGVIQQTPPQVSAVKIHGQAAYRRARRGEKFEIKPRQIEIKKIDVISYAWPYVTLRIVTGPGAYIRALARDLGRRLGTGAYLADLERSRVGEFTADNAIHLPANG